MLLNELFRNADTFRNSTYMHKSVDEKLVLGPLWDFDHAIGNDGDAEDNATIRAGSTAASPWAERFYAARRIPQEDGRALEGAPEPRPQSATSWRRSTAPPDSSRRPSSETSRAGLIRAQAPRPNHAEAVDYLKSWLKARIRWIDENVTERNFSA